MLPPHMYAYTRMHAQKEKAYLKFMRIVSHCVLQESCDRQFL